MRRIVHISDLHFGKDRADLSSPLLERIGDLGPDLVAVSGDLTQRARVPQFRAARAFLDRIEAPLLTVPGNHDIPLDRPFTRLLRPFARYRRWIGRDLEPTFEDDRIVAVGINTVNRFAWQAGHLGTARLARAAAALGRSGDGRLRVIVAHHPLEHPGPSDKKPIPRAARAIAQLLDYGADLVLSGHLHSWHVSRFARAADGIGMGVQLHAGTSLSSRVRGEPNDFNVIDVTPDNVRIARHAFSEEARNFQLATAHDFARP